MRLDDDARHLALVIVGNHGQWSSMAIFRRDILSDENDSAFEPFVRQIWNGLRGVYWKGRRSHVRLRPPCYFDLAGGSLHADGRNRLSGKPQSHSRVSLPWKNPADVSVKGVGCDIGSRSKIGRNEIVHVGQLIFVHVLC